MLASTALVKIDCPLDTWMTFVQKLIASIPHDVEPPKWEIGLTMPGKTPGTVLISAEVTAAMSQPDLAEFVTEALAAIQPGSVLHKAQFMAAEIPA